MILRGRDALYLDIVQLIRAVSDCLQAGHVFPSLILVYTSIDILATLDRPAGAERSGRANFCRWTNEFMLPHEGLPVSAMDIYGARCALLHNLSFRSELSNAKKARAFAYSWGKADHRVLKHLLQSRESEHIPVRVETLVEAFLRAVDRFRAVMEEGGERAERIFQRAETELFMSIAAAATAG